MEEFYVYEYRYPDTKIPFYVGKGCGTRYLQHKYKSKNNNRFVRSVIEKLRRRGLEPEIERIFFTSNEDVALMVEEHLIRSYGLRDDGGLLCNFSIGGKGNKKYKFSDESMELLGKVNDQVVADIEGCCRENVGYIRRGLGIPKCEDKPNSSLPPYMGGWNKIEIPDDVKELIKTTPLRELSVKTGIGRTSLNRAKYEMGLSDAMDIAKKKDLSGETTYDLENETGDRFTGHRYEIASMLRLPVGDLYNFLKRKQKTCKGWRILDE